MFYRCFNKNGKYEVFKGICCMIEVTFVLVFNWNGLLIGFIFWHVFLYPSVMTMDGISYTFLLPAILNHLWVESKKEIGQR